MLLISRSSIISDEKGFDNISLQRCPGFTVSGFEKRIITFDSGSSTKDTST